MSKYFLQLLITVTFLTSCNYNKTKDLDKVVARVNNEYLYKSQLQNLVLPNTSLEDSSLLVNNYIDRWATKKLFYSKSLTNLSLEKQSEFDGLVEDYRYDLYTNAYLNGIVKNRVDTIINEEEKQKVFNNNKLMFKLKEEIFKLRFIKVPLDYKEFNSLKSSLLNFKEEDIDQLDSLKIHFVNYNFNDSIWQKKYLIKLEFLDSFETNNIGQLLEFEDSLSKTLLVIKDYKGPNDFSPQEFVDPILKKIILNKRKLAFIKKLETDIVKNAIKDKNFEIFK